MRTWPALRVEGLLQTDAAGASSSDLVQAALTDFEVAAIEDVSVDQWRVFFGSPGARDGAASALAEMFPALRIDALDIPDEDWARRSQAELGAVYAGRIMVAPPWSTEPAGERLRVVIEPSMGFGTGHHATTRLCLEALQRVSLGGGRVADIGTGSGVLAITASLLGASHVVAIDADEDAVRAAIDNVALNPPASVHIQTRDLREFGESGFDVATANLTGALLMDVSSRLENLVRLDGTLILSGLLADESEQVQACFTRCALTARHDEDGWVSLTLTRRSL